MAVLKLSIQAVKELLNVPIHHYVAVVDYKALFEIVNDIGGIDINIEHKGGSHYDDNAIKPALRHSFQRRNESFRRSKSNGILRYRKGYASGDLGRIQLITKIYLCIIG